MRSSTERSLVRQAGSCLRKKLAGGRETECVAGYCKRVTRRALRSLIAASALLLLSSCAFILGILGIDIKISGNIDVADGNPNGHTILVALATAIPGGGNVTFVTPPQS